MFVFNRSSETEVVLPLASKVAVPGAVVSHFKRPSDYQTETLRPRKQV